MFSFIIKRCLVFVILLLLAGCGPAVQKTIEERNDVIGESSAQSNFQEAKQIKAIEEWKDNPSKIVNVYLLNPVSGGLLVPPVQCLGVPASSTESLEPNNGFPRYSGASAWLVPIDGVDTYTQEMTGRDGTYGDPVHFRQCLTVDGQYMDFPAYGLPYIVSSASYVFPDSTVKRDYVTEAKLLLAEAILARGGCIDVETLAEISCPVSTFVPTPSATVIP